MEQRFPNEVAAKEQLRAQQRAQFLEALPLKTMVGGMLRRSLSSTEINEQGITGKYTGILGERMHSILFAFAATARNPTELNNIFIFLSKQPEDSPGTNLSVRNFLENVPTPRNLEVSIPAAKLTQQFLNEKDEVYLAQSFFDTARIDYSANRPYLLEAFFNLLSSPAVSKSRKEKIIKALSSISFYPPHVRGTVFDKDASFWRRVDGSWVNAELSKIKEEKKTTEQLVEQKEPKIPRDFEEENKGLRELLASYTNTNAGLQKRVDELQKEVDAGSKRERDLWNTINNLRQGRETSGSKAQKKPWWEVLELPKNAPYETIKKAWREKSFMYHEDGIIRGLSTSTLSEEKQKMIRDLANKKFTEITVAWNEAQEARRQAKPPTV